MYEPQKQPQNPRLSLFDLGIQTQQHLMNEAPHSEGCSPWLLFESSTTLHE